MTMNAIPGYDGYFADENGCIYSDKYGQPKMLTQSRHYRRPYLRVCVRVNGKTKTPWVHDLVLLAFSGPMPLGQEARHLDGNPQNNRKDNLTWGTPTENAADKERHGTKARGESCGSSKLTESEVMEMRRLHLSGLGYRKLAVKYGVSRANVRRACLGITWRHLPLP